MEQCSIGLHRSVTAVPPLLCTLQSATATAKQGQLSQLERGEGGGGRSSPSEQSREERCKKHLCKQEQLQKEGTAV
jgi:hypothetical protein